MDAGDAMGSEFLARTTLARMNLLEARLRGFAQHAQTLARLGSPAIDSRDLLAEAGRLMQELIKAAEEFGGAKLQGRSLVRGMSGAPPKSSGVGRFERYGPPPAAIWGSELQAAEKRFRKALLLADSEVRKLQGAALDGLNKPTRTSTSIESLFDLIMAVVQTFSSYLESQKKR